MRILRLFARVLGVELLKVKRTLALAMVILAPVSIVLLHGLIAYAGADGLTRGGRPAWPQLVGNAVGMWTLLLMPLFITLETSLLAGLEHHGNWKAALTLPAPRWMIYAAKLVLTIGLLWAAHAALAIGLYGAGLVLRAIQPSLELTGLPLSPLLRPLAIISGAALLGLAIQHWVSLRWQSFPVAMGFGMFAMITSVVAVNASEWGRRLPWALPMHAVRPSDVPDVELIAVGVIGAVIVGIIGAIEFSRREIG